MGQAATITAVADEPPVAVDREPIRRWTLHDELVSRLRDMIIEGELVPGQRVHEGQLGKTLGVSRTPLREALKFLASEGLVELVAGRGAVIRKLSPGDVQDMLEVLGEIEALGARLACERASDAEIVQVRVVHDDMMRCYETGRRLDYYKRNQAIHSALAQLSGNAFLATTHATMQSRLKRIRFIGNGAPDRWRGAVEEHGEIMASFEARDATRLSQAVKRHMQQTWMRVRDSL